MLNYILILIIVIALHIFVDFHCQGILADMKQKSWWVQHPQYSDLYQYDYLVVLIMHSIEWSFFVMLPFLVSAVVFRGVGTYIFFFIFNTIIHACVDDMKANRMMINLAVDQVIHIIQLGITWIVFYFAVWM